MARRMLGRMYEGEDCAAARALELVGERWSLLILRDALFRHFTRYSQFQSSLAIAPNILAKRLNTLVEAGILRTHALESRGQEYLLTEMGQSLKPVIVSLTRWGDHWIGPGPVDIVHQQCGTEVEYEIHCAACGDDVDLADVQTRLRSRQPAEYGANGIRSAGTV
ncbi:winged helix-turn-helix transcriptional regulator [Nonomuraea dietziae]|uniref:DNA-binding HxlR family transcriptional regulator n=2 Tax=Nonomuraea dietziae TaxID=65515 RepID=A0A7W5VB10_9ACTN|nr:helix-turn-helix domain-containing protein [Nonomuraea dietziae]MBB3733951.1 DNA-binding HxlR family transcriptional regulator [Nonomuraea dietziae]